MADFCRQCYYELFNESRSDFTRAGKEKKPLEPGYGYPELCEGCGPILVDNNGNCISNDCLRKGHSKYARHSNQFKPKKFNTTP